MESPELTAVSPRPEPGANASVDRLDHSVPVDAVDDPLDAAEKGTESNHSTPTPTYIPKQRYKNDTTDSETIGVSVPDGGRRAWLVVIGGFLDFAIAFGRL